MQKPSTHTFKIDVLIDQNKVNQAELECLQVLKHSAEHDAIQSKESSVFRKFILFIVVIVGVVLCLQGIALVLDDLFVNEAFQMVKFVMNIIYLCLFVFAMMVFIRINYFMNKLSALLFPKISTIMAQKALKNIRNEKLPLTVVYEFEANTISYARKRNDVFQTVWTRDITESKLKNYYLNNNTLLVFNKSSVIFDMLIFVDEEHLEKVTQYLDSQRFNQIAMNQ